METKTIYVRHTGRGRSWVLSYKVWDAESFMKVLQEQNRTIGVEVEIASEQEYLASNPIRLA